MVEARDEEAADAWVVMGSELLAQVKTFVDAELPEPLRQCKEMKELLDALFAASFNTKDSAAFVTVEIKGLTPAKVKAIVEVFTGTM